MFIDTHSKTSMEKSICEYLNVSLIDLYNLFETASQQSQKEYFVDGDKLNEVIDEFICSRLPETRVDQVLFFHLSRRLNSAESCNSGNNLYELLSSQNPTTDFLRTHDVEFSPNNGRLDLVYKGNIVLLEDTFKEHLPYLRWRLGHNPNRIDYCFNGFLLKDLLYRNSYARELYDVPEFIGVLASFLKHREIGTDYFQNSTYCCYEYCVPLSRIHFDDNESLKDEDRDKYLINRVLHRLYDYYGHDIRYMFDHDNPIIRLADNDTMPEEYFVAKEEIAWEMLG